MKLMNNKGFVRKILTVLLVIMLFNFTIPIQSQADDNGFGGKLFKPIFQLLAAVADIPVGLLHHTMLETHNLVDSVMLDAKNQNVTDGIWKASADEWSKAEIKKKLKYGPAKSGDATIYDGFMDEDGWLIFNQELDVPNILYCPEYIFANRIAALDANFINPGTYVGGEEINNSSTRESMAGKLSTVVATWYKAFRNLAIVALLSILVYIGIRIIIGATAEDKAKYKERLKDWIVAMCLLFAMHYIMAGVMLMSEVVTNNLSKGLDDKKIYVMVDNYDPPGPDGAYDLYFNTNYMGYIRFMVQSSNGGDAMAYLIMYIALVIYTIMFTITYIKRLLFMAFFTIISPLVAMTYPLDKLADGSAQGFNTWFREYMFNALIQPIHLIIYSIIMVSVMSLAVNNPIYGIVALGFMLPAEKFIKKMFRFDKAQSSSALGTVAGGALAMKGLQSVGKMTRSIGSGKGGNEKIRTKESPELIGDKREKNPDVADPVGVLGAEATAGAASSLNSRNNSSNQNTQTQSQRVRMQRVSNNNANRRIVNVPVRAKKPTQSSITTKNGKYRLASGKSYKPVKVKPPTFRQRLGNTASVLGNQTLRNLHRIPGKIGNKAITGVKGFPKFAVKTGARAVGIGTLGALAAGAAVTTGDAKTAASMVGTGAMLGNSIGGALGGRLGDSAQRSSEQFRETVNDAWKYTEADKRKIEKAKREKYDKEWKQREEHYKYLRSKRMSDKDAKTFLDSSDTQEFLNAGITDINLIYNAQKMKKLSNGKMDIKGAVARAQLASKVSDNFKNSDSEQNAFAERMQRKNKNIDTEKLIKEIKKLKSKDY